MNILVACEESQTVTVELRRLGHRAFSCDMQPCRLFDHPEWHIFDDALTVINGFTIFTTLDGQWHRAVEHCRWDMIIAHPPCTYLSNVGNRFFSCRATPAKQVTERWRLRAESAVFFMQLALADCERIAVENPIGFMSAAYRKPDQVIHPWMFAADEHDEENYVTKATCLWLKNLPPLQRTNNLPKPDNKARYGAYASGKAKTWEDSVVRGSKARSKTFPGIARAMAEQWAGRACENPT